jgi:hypothetical protein
MAQRGLERTCMLSSDVLLFSPRHGSQRMTKTSQESNIRRYRRHGGRKAKPDKVSTANDATIFVW